jgi:DNA-binding XRE family transcriptional regulator
LYGRDWKSPLADALGISRLTVQRWDSGQLKPNIGHVADMLALVAANNDRLNNIIRDTVKPSRHTGKL